MSTEDRDTADGRTPTGTTSRSVAAGAPSCPFCGSEAVDRELAFGSALSKSQYSCGDCGTVFERIRWERRRPATAADREGEPAGDGDGR